jgi:hypothetical protein
MFGALSAARLLPIDVDWGNAMKPDPNLSYPAVALVRRTSKAVKASYRCPCRRGNDKAETIRHIGAVKTKEVIS